MVWMCTRIWWYVLSFLLTIDMHENAGNTARLVPKNGVYIDKDKIKKAFIEYMTQYLEKRGHVKHVSWSTAINVGRSEMKRVFIQIGDDVGPVPQHVKLMFKVQMPSSADISVRWDMTTLYGRDENTIHKVVGFEGVTIMESC
jgi:hypothetical protein